MIPVHVAFEYRLNSGVNLDIFKLYIRYKKKLGNFVIF